MNQLALDGQVDNRDEVIEELRAENRRLHEELRLAKLEIAKGRSENESVLQGVQEIRSLLTPLYRGLRLTFGEMDALPMSTSASTNGSASGNPKRAVWDKWVEKFGRDSLNSRFIIALLDHGEMTSPQLRVVMQCAQNSVGNTATRLKQLGLVTKSGSKFSLKEL